MINNEKFEKNSYVEASPILTIFQGLAERDARKPLQIDALHNAEPLTTVCSGVVNYKYKSIYVLSFDNE